MEFLSPTADPNATEADRREAAAALKKARRSWDWVSYTIDDAGVIAVTPYSSGESDMWFNIQFAVVKSTLMMMGAHPLWAPANQTHILRSTSVVTSVTLSSDDLAYETWLSFHQTLWRHCWG